jgi:peptide chain release factor subunit 1
MMEDGKSEKKIMVDIEPFKPINIFTYKCQNSFHTDPLHSLLEDDEKFGFIIMDGNGVLFGTLQGSNREVLQRMSVQLPKKHGRGGQSAMRFARQRVEKRDAYVSKCCEMSVQHFITDDKINCKGLVLAGSASFKNELAKCEKFDKRLECKILGLFDIAYGQDNGFSQAIELASDCLSNVKFVQEKKMLQAFYDEIAMDTQMVVFGVEDTLKAMELSALKRMILYEDIEVSRYEFSNPAKGGEKRIRYLNENQEKDPKNFKDPETGVELEITSTEPLSDWLLMHYGNYGVAIELISDQSSEGFQFVKGFGGIGGFLRYKIELDEVLGDAGGNYDDFDPEDDFI